MIEYWAWRPGLETDEQDNPNSWGTCGDKHATVTIGVPAGSKETTLRPM